MKTDQIFSIETITSKDDSYSVTYSVGSWQEGLKTFIRLTVKCIFCNDTASEKAEETAMKHLQAIKAGLELLAEKKKKTLVVQNRSNEGTSSTPVYGYTEKTMIAELV